MSAPLTFENGRPPQLVYATKQVITSSNITRAIHRHEDFTELLLVYQGTGQYVVEGYTYTIQPGDILLYNQGDLHEVTSSSHHEIGTLCFGISGLKFAGMPYGHFCTPETGFVRPAEENFDQFYALSRLLYDCTENKSAYPTDLGQYLLPTLVLLAANQPADSRSREQTRDIILANRIRQYIGTHFTEPLTLESISEALSISPYYISHVFKDIIGMSPIHYMIRCRVGEAQNLLISTDYSATQIAAIVGYTNVNHFNSIFAKLVGLPPIRYRRQYLENMQGRRIQ